MICLTKSHGVSSISTKLQTCWSNTSHDVHCSLGSLVFCRHQRVQTCAGKVINPYCTQDVWQSTIQVHACGTIDRSVLNFVSGNCPHVFVVWARCPVNIHSQVSVLLYLYLQKFINHLGHTSVYQCWICSCHHRLSKICTHLQLMCLYYC